MPAPPIRWHRFVQSQSAGWTDLVELAVDDCTLYVYVRRRDTISRAEAAEEDEDDGGYGKPAREREFASPQAAAKAMAEHVAGLRGEGYHEEGVRLGPPPQPARERAEDRAFEARWRATLLDEARADFEKGLPRFCDAWAARGHDARLDFHEAAKRRLEGGATETEWHRSANDLADQCIRLAEKTFAVFFDRRTTTLDEEHGTRQDVKRSWLASFYGSPVGVLVIARCKLRDECRDDDDADAPGLADELTAWLDARLGPLPPPPVIARPPPPPTAPPPKPRQSQGDAVLADAILAHVRRRTGPPADPYADEDARWVRLDVLVLRPAAPGSPLLFCTTGMAERPIPGTAGPRIWTELEMRLPSDAPAAVPEPAKRVPGKRKPRLSPPWPVVWLQHLARKPHQDGAAYRAPEIVALPAPADASPFAGALLLPSDLFSDLALVGRTVTFLTVCPLYAAELAWGREHGAEAVTEAFRARGVDPRVLDPGRLAIMRR